MSEDPLRLSLVGSLSNVKAEEWDPLVGGHHPFMEYAFLSTLEETGCVGGRSGWAPRYLLVHRMGGEQRELVGAAPAYLKDNSYGEYIFDWGWADASQRAGIPYYPKLVIAAPFTPATGPRTLVASGDDEAVRRVLAQGALAAAKELGCHSVHWLFTEAVDQQALVSAGYLSRSTYQFHWRNDDYGDFEGFLSALTAKRRKEIRRERRRARDSGCELAMVPGTDLTLAEIDAIYTCYRSTVDGHGQIPYLSRAFFERLTDPRLGALVSVARDNGRLVAMALAFHRGPHLYGRYWGAERFHDALHFELCYYSFIEWGLNNGVTLFEAGAQGHHKLARGFLPSITRSAHWLAHRGLSDAVARFLTEEATSVDASIRHFRERGPFRRPADPA